MGKKSLVSCVLAQTTSVGFKESWLDGMGGRGFGLGWKCELDSCLWSLFDIEVLLNFSLRYEL